MQKRVSGKPGKSATKGRRVGSRAKDLLRDALAAPPEKTRSKKSEASDGDTQRLHKRIAASGLCSRRAAEVLIKEGRVTVNGESVTEMGVKVGPDDVVSVDGQEIGIAKLYTLVMNKPLGVVTTLRDPQGRPTVRKFLPDLGVQLKPVGRLDMDSEGLILFTNDGELALRLMHPRHGVEKEYHVVVVGEPDQKALEHLRKGIWIPEGGKTRPAKVELMHPARGGETSMIRITLHEGRKRQIRLMCEAIGHPVRSLRRVRIGSLVLRNMPPGSCRMLGKRELDALREQAGLD